MLAQGWSNTETSTEWARQNLTGADKTAFYAQVGYNLAHQSPDAALRVLAELQGTDAYASTFGAMMRLNQKIGEPSNEGGSFSPALPQAAEGCCFSLRSLRSLAAVELPFPGRLTARMFLLRILAIQ